MASDLGVSISVSAVVGGALSGLTNIGRAMKTLETTTASLQQKQKELGRTLEANHGRLGVQSAKQLWQEYDRLESSVLRLTERTKKLKEIQSLRNVNAKQWEGIKSNFATAAASAGVVAMPVKLAMDFESSMADVKKVVDFESPAQIKEMEQDILRMTRSIPMAATELTAIAASGGQLGIARQDLAGFTETIAKMGVAFDMPAEQAGDAMAKLANVYKIPIAQIGKLGDAINHLSNSSPAKASDIVNTLGRVGGVADKFGLSVLQTASLSNAFIALGKTPEVAGTAINGMLTKLMTADKQGAKFQAALKGMGTDAKALKKAIAENGEQALIDFLKQVEKLPKEGQMGALVDLFGLEYADDVAALVGGLDTYRQSVEALQKTGKDGLPEFSGSMEREFAARSATTANQFKLMQQALAELGIAIGNILLPAANDFLSWMTHATHGLTNLINQYPRLSKGIIVAVASLLTLVSGGFMGIVVANRLRAAWLLLRSVLAAGTATWSSLSLAMSGNAAVAAAIPGHLGGVARALSAARTAMLGFSLASLTAMWPVVLAVGAIAAAAFLIYKYWQPIKGFFAGLWDGVKQGLEPVAPMLDGLAAVLSGLWIQVQPYVQPIIDWFGDFFSVTQVAEGGARSFGQAVGQFIGGALAAVVGFVGNAMLQIQAAFNGGLNGILNLIVNWSPLGAFYSAFAAVLSWFGITLPAQFSGFGGMIMDGLINGIKAGAARAAAAIQNVANNLTTRFKSALRIHSPSRVFVGLGGFVTQGLDLGLSRGADQPVSTVGAMAGRLKNRFAERMGQLRSDIAARVSGSSADFAAARAQQAAPVSAAASGALTVHFSPTIHAPGGDPAQIQTAVQMGLREFEQLFNRLMADRERRSY